jgi:large subunit ribosomal protein L34e
MVAGNKKSRSAKRTQKVIPSNISIVRYRKKKPGIAKCQLTGQKLNGVPRVSKSKLKRMPKSMRRPKRPFGGALSPVAMKRVLIQQARD